MYLLLLLCVGTCVGKMWLVETKGNNTQAGRNNKMEAGEEYSENENNLGYDTNQGYKDYVRYDNNQEFEDYQNDGPTLEMIYGKICDVWEGGTDNWVWVNFRNGKKETCVTEKLDNEGNSWGRGSDNEYRGNWFSNCNTGIRCCLHMTPSDGLEVKLEHCGRIDCSDNIKICGLDAKFSNNQLWRFVSKRGTWSDKYSYVTQRRQTEWLKMCRVCSSAEEKGLSEDEKKHCCKKYQF